MKKLVVVALSLALAFPTQVQAATTPTSCPQYEALLRKHAPAGGWDIKLMSHYMARESRCNANARSRTADSGLLQINDVNLAYLSRVFNTKVTPTKLMNASFNIRAAAALCSYWRRGLKFSNACYIPWKPVVAVKKARNPIQLRPLYLAKA